MRKPSQRSLFCKLSAYKQNLNLIYVGNSFIHLILLCLRMCVCVCVCVRFC